MKQGVASSIRIGAEDGRCSVFAFDFVFRRCFFPCDAAKKLIVKADKKRICLSPQGEFMRFPL
jgi:hypothetical protein